MSGSLLEDKENVAISHEFAKEDPAHITSSILKPSQKQNVGQLTPKKPPKVSPRCSSSYSNFLLSFKALVIIKEKAI